jgi:O-antigen ligase
LGEKIDDVRKKVSNPGGNLIILAFVLGLLQNRINLGNLFPKFLPRFIAIPLLFLSFFLSFSRTGLISLILLVFSILGFVGRINLRAIFSIGLLIFGIIFILTTPEDEVGTFRSKIARSGKEIAVSDYENMNDINRNWRGFETYRALDTFMSGNLSQKILGQGFGALVDLGFTMTLGEVEYSKIPILHNGYAYILVKTGLIGILCYVFFYYILIKHSFKFKNSIDQEHIFLSRLLLGITLSLIFSMIVVGGMAEIHDSEFVLLAGYILRRIEQV